MSLIYLLAICSVFITANAKSFTVVIDTTYSMQTEINVIRTRLGSTLSAIKNKTFIDNYVLVPFNDPDVGPTQVHNTVDAFLSSFDLLKVSRGEEGGDEPEYSLSGLEKALQESKSESDVFLFTDACAKDEAKFDDVKRLCEVTGSKVFIFMSGRCSYLKGNIAMYYHVTKVCSGNVFQVDHLNYGQVFEFMMEIVTTNYNEVTPFEVFQGHRQLSISAEILTTDIIVAVTGNSPTLQIIEASGYRRSPRTQTLIVNQYSQVDRIVNPRKGLTYEVIASSSGQTSVTIYKRNDFPLQVGFSPFRPGSIEETSSDPLPGQDSFIFVLVPKTFNYKLTKLTIYLLNEDRQKTISLSESRAQIYIAQTYFKHGSKFKLTIEGMDTVTPDSEPVRMKSKSYETQTEATTVLWSAALIESVIPESKLTEYNKNARVACKVTGYPKPTIWWEDETGQKMNSEDRLLQYPATYISYVEIPNFTENRTITCKASTSSGQDSRDIELYVYRPYVFTMVRTPEDTTIKYEEEGKLYCEVEAYPDPTIKWYFNDNEIQFLSNEIDIEDTFMFSDKKQSVEYYKEDNTLVIKNMTSVYAGTYRCDARNEANYKTYTAEVRISGLEPPELEMDTDLTSKLGEEVEISCRVTKGKPNPKISWKYKPVDDYDFTDLPDDVHVDNDKLSITEIMSKHKGIYKCEAANEKGEVSKEINLKVIYAPKIENAETATKEVYKETLTVLECNVDAEPKATVRWERSDLTQFPDDKHNVEGNSLKFVARLNDSGVYRCIAENEAGTAEKSINVDVTVRPFITPYRDSVYVRTGSTLKLPCIIQEANPPPAIEWWFTSKDSVHTRKPGDKELIISRVTKADAGTYKCFAENKVGQDRIEIAVYVD